MAFDDDILSHFNSMDDEQRRRTAEYERLLAEPCLKPVVAGNRVLVAAGLLGMGYNWIREEATVLEVADTSALVEFSTYRLAGTKYQCWVKLELITDVLS